jgi:hypothetical protein
VISLSFLLESLKCPISAPGSPKAWSVSFSICAKGTIRTVLIYLNCDKGYNFDWKYEYDKKWKWGEDLPSLMLGSITNNTLAHK